MDGIHLMYIGVANELRSRIEAIHQAGKCDSLVMALLDVEIVALDHTFHGLIEAIEDAEAL